MSSKKARRELLQLINHFSKVNGYKINSNNPGTFLYSKEEGRSHQSVNATVLLRRGKKRMFGSRRREGSGRERRVGGKGGSGSDMGGDGEELQRESHLKGGLYPLGRGNCV